MKSKLKLNTKWFSSKYDAIAACCAILLKSLPSNCRTDSPLNWKRLRNCPNQHFFFLQHNSEFQSWFKTRQNNSEKHNIRSALAANANYAWKELSWSVKNFLNLNLKLNRSLLCKKILKSLICRPSSRPVFSFKLPCVCWTKRHSCYWFLSQWKAKLLITFCCR